LSESVDSDRETGLEMYTLYSMQRSGNSYKVRLALAQLGVPFRKVEIDILQGESKTPEFLAMNPSGQVPLLEVAPGRFLAESNAILWYLAHGSPLVPTTRSSAPKRCSGCSSSSTAWSRTSAPRSSGWR
jgi:glutathione S-transferase